MINIETTEDGIVVTTDTSTYLISTYCDDEDLAAMKELLEEVTESAQHVEIIS